MKTLQDLYAENPQDYMALAAEGNKSGKILAVNENDELVLVEQTPVKMSYKFHRASEYPPLGDMIDAFCKAKAGDDTELIALMACS